MSVGRLSPLATWDDAASSRHVESAHKTVITIVYLSRDLKPNRYGALEVTITLIFEGFEELG